MEGKMRDIQLESVWPSWHVEEMIGSGPYGVVYKAKHIGFNLERDIYSAVKVIRIPADDEEISRMQRDGMSAEQSSAYYENIVKGLIGEVQRIETLRGASNIVSIEDHEVKKNPDGIGWTIFIRMELLKNLDQYIAGSSAPTGAEDVVRLGIDICSALEHFEKKQIFHENIKRTNIFIDEFGSFKLGDFGLGRYLEAAYTGYLPRYVNDYTAPEIYRREPYNASVDIYALGMIMYQMLNRGRIPFVPLPPQGVSDEDQAKAVSARLGGAALPMPADGGKALGDIVCRAGCGDIHFRYAHPAEMKNDLLSWQAGLSQAGMNGAGPAGLPWPEVETDENEGGRKKKGKRLPVLLASLGVLILFGVFYFFIPISHGETLFNKTAYALSGKDSRFRQSMEKGDNAYDSGDYDEALYFYRERALAEDDQSIDAWIGVLKVYAADVSDSEDTIWENILSVLSSIGALSADPEDDQKQSIIESVNAYMDGQGQKLLDDLKSGNTNNAQIKVEEFFDKYRECSSRIAEKVDCGSDNARWYVAFYDELSEIEGCEDYAIEILEEGSQKYTDDRDLALRQETLDEERKDQVYAEIDEALSKGDFDTAYALAEESRDLFGEDYEDIIEDIDYIKERTDFLISLKDMLDAEDYEGIISAILEDRNSNDKISSCYLVDGVFKTSIEEGTGLLYDDNGVYYGEIKNNIRSGSGVQVKCYSDGDYELMDGTWDEQANGECTFTWWDSNGTKAVVSGNFTDGYEDGTMTIEWSAGDTKLSASYTAQMGTYTSIIEEAKDGSYIYVFVTTSNGGVYYWATNNLNNNGFFLD